MTKQESLKFIKSNADNILAQLVSEYNLTSKSTK